MIDACYVGDVRDGLRSFIASGIRAQTCVTSPPYWGLRDYGTAQWDGGDAECDHDAYARRRNGQAQPGSGSGAGNGGALRDKPRLECSCGATRIDRQIGLEPTIAEYVATMVDVFRLVREVLADDGTLWLNLGDSYSGDKSGGRNDVATMYGPNSGAAVGLAPKSGLAPKQLCGIPWRVAFALQADGWYLRSDIIWAKPNPMPESVTDRPTKAHEYLFLLAKSERYYYDQDAILEPVSGGTHARLAQNIAAQIGSARANGGAKTNGNMKAVARKGSGGGLIRVKDNENFASAVCLEVSQRNRRTVWTIPTESYSDAHFATFPRALVEPCILAGSRVGDVVLDPFMGSGTVAQVAQDLGRRWIGCELNGEYVKMQDRRTAQAGLDLRAAAD